MKVNFYDECILKCTLEKENKSHLRMEECLTLVFSNYLSQFGVIRSAWLLNRVQ